ncbi:transcriptional regulator GcvA [Sedimenticola selenatireducens]|uniref:Transcriptional regulator GcvA n=1 Tax=Sedimenticola selenatireducens TaxID=191960 RepID=A0A557SK30_9GAMM|nr:transcriptional regulator GcvA [Sedimenticola selenatireducens]TVO77786.1 transcriptional regulator GcvA [Sedimenticola selenatireducens]TVT65091.1 MAG: transcriptional regulator GcvA [Sedimenticola selenatireducens]
MITPPLNAIRAFEAAARHLSFSLAAEELHVTASAVSHQIKTLEEYLDIKLFIRQTRQVTLTPEAQAYLPAIRMGLDQINEATRRAMSRQDTVIRINLAPAIAGGWLIPRLYDFYNKHTDVEIEITTSMKLVDFNRSDVDLAVRFGKGHWQGLRSHLLLNELLIPVCSPKLLTKNDHPESPEALLKFPLLHVKPKATDWQEWFQAAGIAHEALKMGAGFQSSPLMLDAVEAGLGYGIVSRHLVEQELASNRIVIPFDISLIGSNGYYLVYPENRCKDHKVVLFRDWVLNQTKTTTDGGRSQVAQNHL